VASPSHTQKSGTRVYKHTNLPLHGASSMTLKARASTPNIPCEWSCQIVRV